MSTVRKVPMRKCVGCGEMKNKKELIRVLKTPEGEILLDAGGRKNGRGAYLCPSSDCLRKAERSRGLERSLGVATHGYSSSAQAFAGDTRWSDIAEQNGFIVVYTQAYPSDDQRGNIPVPYWNTMEKGELMEGLPDDVSYFRQMIADIEQQYNIDDSRLYATGHSNGSCMTWMLAMHASDLFAAVAPIGGHLGTHLDTVPEDAEPLPIWITLGDYDYEPTTGTDTGYMGCAELLDNL